MKVSTKVEVDTIIRCL